MPGAHAGGKPGSAPRARAGRGQRGSASGFGSHPEHLHWASWGLSSLSRNCPHPPSVTGTPTLNTTTTSLSYPSSPLSCVPGTGWPLTSLYSGLPCLATDELMALPTLNFTPLPFTLTSLPLVGGPSLIPHHCKPDSSSEVLVARTLPHSVEGKVGEQKLLATVPVCPGFPL